MTNIEKNGYQPPVEKIFTNQEREAKLKELKEKYGPSVEALKRLLESDEWFGVEDVKNKVSELGLSGSEPVIVRDFRKWSTVADSYVGLTQAIIISEEQSKDILKLFSAPEEEREEVFLAFPELDDLFYLWDIINKGLLTQNGNRELSYTPIGTYPIGRIPKKILKNEGGVLSHSSATEAFSPVSQEGGIQDIEIGIDIKTIDTIFEPPHEEA